METTKASRVKDFIEMAVGARTDSEKQNCQTYFRETLMGNSGNTRESVQCAFLRAASDVAGVITQSQFQINETYDTIMARIPASHGGVQHALRKVALNIGLIDAPGWGGK